MCHFPSSETQGNFRLVAVFEKTPQIAKLDLIVAFVGTRPEFYFLNLDLLLLFPSGLLFFAQLEPVLAVIHDSANRRLRVSVELHQIQSDGLSALERFLNGHNAHLLAVLVNKPHFRYPYGPVEPLLVDRWPTAEFLRSQSDATVLLLRSTPLSDLGADALGKRVRRHGAEIFASARTHGHVPGFHLAVTDDQHIRNSVDRVLADFKADFLISQVDVDAHALFGQAFGNLFHVVRLPIGNVHHHRLRRRQPRRPNAGVVLDQDAYKAFHGAQHGAVQHHRHAAAVVFGHILGAEPARQHQVKLQRSALPNAIQAVPERKLDLGAVERAFARLQLP